MGRLLHADYDFRFFSPYENFFLKLSSGFRGRLTLCCPLAALAALAGQVGNSVGYGVNILVRIWYL